MEIFLEFWFYLNVAVFPFALKELIKNIRSHQSWEVDTMITQMRIKKA